MITVPDEIKELLHQDHCQKNIRIHFPNGERSDICNDLIVKDSVSFTESLCSQNELKFGLCESPVFECEVVGVGNIKGATIEVFCEIFCSPTVSGAVFQPDIRQYVYQILYGTFVISEAKRQADMIHRKIQAYSYIQMNKIKNNVFLDSLVNTSWFRSNSIVIDQKLLEAIYFKNSEAKSVIPLNPRGQSYDIRLELWGSGALSIERRSGQFLYKVFDAWRSIPYTDTYDHLTYEAFEVEIDRDFDLENYLNQCSKFEADLRSALENVNISESKKEQILMFTKPHVSYCNNGTFTTLNYAETSGSGAAYYFDYITNNHEYGARFAGFSPTGWITQDIFKEAYECTDDRIFVPITKKFTTGINWLMTGYSNPLRYVAANNVKIFAPSNGLTIWVIADNVQKITFTGEDLTGKFSIGVKSLSYSSGDPADKTNLTINRDQAITASRRQSNGNWNRQITSVQTVSRTEYVSSSDMSNIDLNDYYSSLIEKNGEIAKINRDRSVEYINIKQRFNLNPEPTLYPSGSLYPEGVTGGKLFPEDYQSCWYEDEYIKPFGAIQCQYKNTDNQDLVYIYYLPGFSESSDEESYQTYFLDNNYVIKSNIWTEQEIHDICETVANNISGVTYMPVDFVGRGLPYVEAGDTFEILTKSNDSITTIVLNRTLTGEQTLTDSYKSV